MKCQMLVKSRKQKKKSGSAVGHSFTKINLFFEIQIFFNQGIF